MSASIRRFLPNYVDSRGGARRVHRIEPFRASGDPAEMWRKLRRIVAALPRTEVVEATDSRLHAVCRTRSGFRDDLEFDLSPADGVVHARSASRAGLHDLGVNRRRVELIRRALGE